MRADEPLASTDPAVGAAGVTVAVLSNREPRRSAGVQDAVVAGLRDGAIAAPHDRERTRALSLSVVGRATRSSSPSRHGAR